MAVTSAVSPHTPRVPAMIASLTQRIDQSLTARLSASRIAPNLRDAVTYAVLAPGKRLRPVLVLLSCRAVGGDGVEDLGGQDGALLDVVDHRLQGLPGLAIGEKEAVRLVMVAVDADAQVVEAGAEKDDDLGLFDR